MVLQKIAKVRLPRNLVKFIKAESTGGVIMMLSAALALLAANSPVAHLYHDIVALPVGLSLGSMDFNWPLDHFVKDVLMVFFFLLIGMELKREMIEGVLADKKQILLPLVAAIGGMAAPAVVFLLINAEVPQHWNGWAIPSATDIAFAVCVLTLVGKSAPPALKIFLLAIAIFDDLGAILVIAFFYNSNLALEPLGASLLVVAVLAAMNRLRIMAVMPYLLVGVALWFGLHEAGIHTTLAGVLVGLFLPLRNPRDASHSPLSTCMHFLHPWVAFCILPIFAFTASGVDLSGLSVDAMLEPLPMGVALGLFLGKQLGIFGTSFLLVKTGLAALPQGTRWLHIYGVSVVAGIGFTMSLFIGILAFSDKLLQEEVKIGVIAGSLMASLWGWLVLSRAK
ncbi:MAG: Na+/H+ antiporter NhaA [Alphaproteobacteria bacterium]|nr:Na+/H+ antiporter NhaA [Alphaproteobacteria bacterium]